MSLEAPTGFAWNAFCCSPIMDDKEREATQNGAHGCIPDDCFSIRSGMSGGIVSRIQGTPDFARLHKLLEEKLAEPA